MRLFTAFRPGLLRPWRAIGSVLAWTISRPWACIEWLSRFRVELWVVEGEEQSSHEPLSVLCASNVEDREYVLQLIFGESYRQRRLGRFWLWSVARAIPASASACSMMIVDACESHLRFARPDNWFLVPIWVFGEVNLPYDEGVSGKASRELRRRIRRHAFELEVTRDPRQFDDFYYNMYTPYVAQTYGKCAKLASHEFFSHVFQQSELMLIRNQEQAIAGMLTLHHGGGPFLWALGVRDGNREYVKDGAASVLYHFCLQYLHEKGYKKALLGWSRAFLRDGVLQFKKHLSQRIVGSYPNGFALRILSPTPGVSAFLCNNPFIFKRRGAYYAAIFSDADEIPGPEELGQLDTDYFHPGLTRLLIYRLRRDAADGTNHIPAELSEHIDVRTLV
jgi:hypothetical protein